jgi:hypothetical protein
MGALRAPRARRVARALLLLALAGGGAACAAPRAASPPAAIDPALEPAFSALGAAVAARDDALAERILARILASDPDEPTRAHAEVYRRILRGRALGRELRLSLAAEPADDGASVEVALLAGHGMEQTLEVRGGAGTLRQLLTGLDGAGTESRLARSVAVEAVERLRLPPGEPRRVRLGRYEVPVGGALGVQARWDLHLPAGTIRADGGDFPLDGVSVAGCETLRLAPWLPQGPVEPGELARYVADGGRSMPAVVERTVRVPLDHRGEALEALVPVAAELPVIDLPVLIPALRWLSEERSLGADAEAWARWLQARSTAPGATPQRPAGPDLPQTAPPRVATVPGPGGER